MQFWGDSCLNYYVICAQEKASSSSSVCQVTVYDLNTYEFYIRLLGVKLLIPEKATGPLRTGEMFTFFYIRELFPHIRCKCCKVLLLHKVKPSALQIIILRVFTEIHNVSYPQKGNSLTHQTITGTPITVTVWTFSPTWFTQHQRVWWLLMNSHYNFILTQI